MPRNPCKYITVDTYIGYELATPLAPHSHHTRTTLAPQSHHTRTGSLHINYNSHFRRRVYYKRGRRVPVDRSDDTPVRYSANPQVKSAIDPRPLALSLPLTTSLPSALARRR